MEFTVISSVRPRVCFPCGSTCWHQGHETCRLVASGQGPRGDHGGEMQCLLKSIVRIVKFDVYIYIYMYNIMFMYAAHMQHVKHYPCQPVLLRQNVLGPQTVRGSLQRATKKWIESSEIRMEPTKHRHLYKSTSQIIEHAHIA